MVDGCTIYRCIKATNGLIIISLFQEGNILSKTAYLQYGLHIINKSIIQECQIINKSAKISRHAYTLTQHLIIIIMVVIT